MMRATKVIRGVEESMIRTQSSVIWSREQNREEKKQSLK